MSLYAFLLGMVFFAIGPFAHSPILGAASMVSGAILMGAALICREIEAMS